MSKVTTWEIDTAHTASQFSVRHMMVATVRGHFEKTTGTVVLDEDDITRSQIDVTIDAASISTRNADRDTHLRSAEFFDVEKFPNLTFKSTKIEKDGDGLKITGDLTMRGVTRPVTLDVEPISPPAKNPWGQTVRGVSATGKLNRKEWGLGWNQVLETGGVLVGDEVKLVIDAELRLKE